MIKLRAHHGMCLLYFIGKGYSDNFVENMYSNKELLEKENPAIEIINSNDLICAKCPNNIDGTCTSIDKVNRYDNLVLNYLNIKPGTFMNYNDFSKKVKEEIINKNLRKQICNDCMWNNICDNIKVK